MLMKSSEIELGASGRAHALRLRDTAQAHLRQSWNVHQVDLGLAEAAMVLALFETSAHPEHDDANADTALLWLDKIIQVLRLTDLDARDPDTLDHSTGVPTVAHPHPLPKQCECTTSPTEATTWSFQPAWDPSWDAAEVKAEETRRLCWSALILVANHTVVRAAEHRKPLNLFLVNSSNVCNPLLCRPRNRRTCTHPTGSTHSASVPFAFPRRISPTSRICLAVLRKRYRLGPLLPQHASLELHCALLG